MASQKVQYDVLIAGSGKHGIDWRQDPERPLASHAGICDLGGEWFNGSTQTRVSKLVKELGLQFVPVEKVGQCVMQDMDGKVSLFDSGTLPNFPKVDRKDIVRVRNLLEKEHQNLDVQSATASELDDMTLEDSLQRHGARERTRAMVGLWSRVMIGCEPHETTALHFLIYCKSQGGLMQMRSDSQSGGKAQAQYYTIRTGAQSIAQGLSTRLRPGTILLSTTVVSVTQDEHSISLSTSQGVYHAKMAIMTLPFSIYSSLTFSPALPLRYGTYSNSAELGYYTKFVLRYSTAWWSKSGLSGVMQSLHGPVGITRGVCYVKNRRFTLTGFIMGESGTRWAALPPKARREQLLQQIAQLLGSSEALHLLEVLEYDWKLDKYSQGAPTTFMKDASVLSRFEKQFKLPWRRLCFAGADLAENWRGYVEGALESGEFAARKVEECLR